MGWQAVAKSVIGVKHIKAGKPCQDYSDYSLEDNGEVLLGAVSDGMGGAQYSDIGSKLAVEAAIKFLKYRRIWIREPDEATLKNIFENLLQDVRNSLDNESQSNGYSIDKLACTLIVFVATPSWLSSMQVGDGQIVVCCSSKRDYQLLFKPDKGEYANETTPVTSTTALREMRFCVKRNYYDFICAATDGIENISLRKGDVWEPFDKFFDGLLESISSNQKSLKVKEKEIEDLLNRQDLNQRTDDDKTILLCAYKSLHQGNSGSSPGIPKVEEPNTRSEISENIRCFCDEIKNHLIQIPEASQSLPVLAIRKQTLEIIFRTNEPLQYFEQLVDRIQELFNDNHIQPPINLKQVIVYNQDKNTLSLYSRLDFKLNHSSGFNFYLVIALASILLVSGISWFAWKLSSNSTNTQPSSSPTIPPSSTPPNSSPTIPPSPTPKPQINQR